MRQNSIALFITVYFFHSLSLLMTLSNFIFHSLISDKRYHFDIKGDKNSIALFSSVFFFHSLISDKRYHSYIKQDKNSIALFKKNLHCVGS